MFNISNFTLPRSLMTDDLYASATEMARAVRNREISSEELVSAHLRRIERLNPVLNSVIQIAPESALEQAKAADEALARGDALGALHGVPFTVKDVYDVRQAARMETAPGMAERPDPVAERDSTAVLRLRAAGAILIAATKATLWTDREERYGSTRNPYDLDRSVSGSSGGEAATIAAGGSPLGMGSDSGGSLRHPSHYCGVATLRPSNGRVPRGSDADGTHDPRTAAGPIARKTEDLELALRLLNGPDGRDPLAAPIPLGDSREILLKGLRVDFFVDNGIVGPTDETAETIRRAAKALESAGAVVEEATPPGMEEAWEITLDYWRFCREEGTLPGYFRFMERWDRYRLAMSEFMGERDALLCPVEAFPATPLNAKGLPAAFTYTTPFSLTGWPCATVRAGTSPEGLPIGAQIVGGPWRDDVALAIARRIESALGGWSPSPLFS
jgi:amidase